MELKKVLIASDSFKGSLSSIEVANAIESGIKMVDKNIKTKKLPIADGGEGTVDAVTSALQSDVVYVNVHDIFMRPIKSKIGLLPNNSAIIETADPLGIGRINIKDLDPLNSTSYGLGELIKKALDFNVDTLYIGLGGSAVNDGGTGLALSLGAKILDGNNNQIPLGAIGLKDLKKIDVSSLDSRLNNLKIILLSDVKNSLCGEFGATFVYGPQKGLDKEMLDLVDKWMENYGKILNYTFNSDFISKEGSGAAGGIGASLVAFTQAEIKNGIDVILDIINLEHYIKDSDLIITGEGRMDRQSIYGKAPIGVAKLSKKHNKLVLAIVGSIGDGIEAVYDKGIDIVNDIINKPISFDYAINNASELIKNSTYLSVKNIQNILRFNN